MQRGPVDFLVAEFREGSFHGGIATAIARLVEQNIVHIIDLVFISKDADGNVDTIEIDALDDEAAGFYAGLDGEFGGLLSDSDLEAVAVELAPGSAAGLIVYENVWAREFLAALGEAGGNVISQARIPAEDVESAFAGLEDA
ncbi:DUF6325 family protein [Nakamurella lactea]|uniref:DUF6325 family protein n=1 Tax=Nakamurella lactea TaxID=459515 RepID=UPI00041ED0E1|nr:DUF6325 family protein [Nakamurella lactea]